MTELLGLGAVPATVRVINLAGELLRPELVRRIYETTSARKVHDLYGPSECTTYSTWSCRTIDGPQNIGRPIANTQVYILDAHLNPVPIGVIGEIYIGGGGVARGYLNRPELTAERFIHHSFDGAPAQRLYRTGDLGRYLPDGNIEFLGRIDNQVKIRGYRIEPGEIEAVLARHPAVQEAEIVTRDDGAGDKLLVAYIVPAASAPAASVFRAYLKAKLPDYMVPSAFVVLESFPLTANGKVDRNALPPPRRDTVSLDHVYVGARSAVEETIAGVWSEVLGISQIGIYDNFFDLGGHSLKATQVLARLRKLFQSEIPLRHLFEFPTIAELSAVIDAKTIANLTDDKLDGLLTEIDAMSEEEVQKLLAQKTAPIGKD
jgi:acyl carrier protein